MVVALALASSAGVDDGRADGAPGKRAVSTRLNKMYTGKNWFFFIFSSPFG
jgi:hypothetical protein